MSEHPGIHRICVVIGASHAGVSFAFALRREGWEGQIILLDADPNIPYHRPPLSKAFLSTADDIEKYLLRPAGHYQEERIVLRLGTTVSAICRKEKHIRLADGSLQRYDKLLIATGARALIPPIAGIDTAKNLFCLRSAADAIRIRQAFQASAQKRVLIIGGGYIGLEAAASLTQLGAEVTVLEQEARILKRVTAPELSDFFQQLHRENGVRIFVNKEVTAIDSSGAHKEVVCADGARHPADVIIVGVGIRVNTELAEEAGLQLENGIRVDPRARSSDEDIYAVGDCSFHYNPHYDRFIRLESVQNAVDQAKVAAAAICGKETSYDAIPWFWSDQYDVKLQMAGLSEGYDQAVLREEVGKDRCFSVWYFKGGSLLAVDAVNNARAYVLGAKFIRGGQKIDRSRLPDPTVELRPANILE